jgi:hypothetical protein
MVQRNGLWFLVVFLLDGCSTSGVVSDVEIQAQRHMAIADTLERASELKEATLEYQIVAEKFPSTSVHAAAVRKAALLFSSPANPAANDSTSLHWLNTYLALTRSPEEKQMIQMYLTMVGRVKELRDSLAYSAIVNDSLAAVTRKQVTEAASRARRVQETETELQKASDELRRLKEIDMRISKSRGKKQP